MFVGSDDFVLASFTKLAKFLVAPAPRAYRRRVCARLRVHVGPGRRSCSAFTPVPTRRVGNSLAEDEAHDVPPRSRRRRLGPADLAAGSAACRHGHAQQRRLHARGRPDRQVVAEASSSRKCLLTSSRPVTLPLTLTLTPRSPSRSPSPSQGNLGLPRRRQEDGRRREEPDRRGGLAGRLRHRVRGDHLRRPEPRCRRGLRCKQCQVCGGHDRAQRPITLALAPLNPDPSRGPWPRPLTRTRSRAQTRCAGRRSSASWSMASPRACAEPDRPS